MRHQHEKRNKTSRAIIPNSREDDTTTIYFRCFPVNLKLQFIQRTSLIGIISFLNMFLKALNNSNNDFLNDVWIVLDFYHAAAKIHHRF